MSKLHFGSHNCDSNSQVYRYSFTSIILLCLVKY